MFIGMLPKQKYLQVPAPRGGFISLNVFYHFMRLPSAYSKTSSRVYDGTEGLKFQFHLLGTHGLSAEALERLQRKRWCVRGLEEFVANGFGRMLE